jgi:hypothetical protein
VTYFLLRFAFVLVFLSTSFGAMGQPFMDTERLFEEEKYFIGITVLGTPVLSFSSISDYQNGVSVTHSTIRVTALLGVVWSVDVRATGNLTYQTNQIPISSIGMQSTNLGTRPEIMLSTTNQQLASGFASLLLNQNMVIRYRAIGGTTFLKPGGVYTTTLIFTYAGL